MINNPPNERKIPSSSAKSLVTFARLRIIRSIRELNLFSDNPFWSSTLNLGEQILSTRLFLIFVSISFLIVIVYTSLKIRTYEVTRKKFSLSDFERLEKLYPNTINAPCSEISIPYNKFLDLSPKFHQVCQSPFIRKKWISTLFSFNATSYNILDFRTFSFTQFRSLGLLCRLARHAVKDTHRTFNSTNFISLHVFPRNQFNEITSVRSNNLQQNVIANEKRTVNVISMIIAQNRLISALRTNYYIESVAGSRSYMTYNGAYLEQNRTDELFCDCRFEGNQCVYPAGAFYNWTLPELGKPAKNNPPPRFQIPGLMAGCIPLDTIRQSTLECLYNESCIKAISLQPKISQPKPLNLSLSRFPLNSTVGSMFDESLFVESWQNKSSFENYFAICAPRTITYKYQGRYRLGTIVTISLSAFGGLVIAWQLVTPAIVKIFNLNKWKKQQNPPSIEVAVIELAPKPINKVLKAHVRRTIYNFNLFPPDNKNDEEEERIGIIATRLYILLIVNGLIIVGVYTSLLKRSQTFTVEWPSLSEFENLYSLHSSTINCPCSNFSMSYGRIMFLSPRYHSICTSEYLKEYWLSYFGRVELDIDSISFLASDFRQNGQAFFDLMKVLCKTSNETVDHALRVFNSTRFVTVNALSRSQFLAVSETRLKYFQQQTISSFVDLIESVRSSIQTNQLAEEMWTNLGPVSIYNNQTSKWLLRFRPRDFYTNSCSCAISNQCTRPVGFYFQSDSIRSQPNITVPGLVLGCYAIDSLLLSTLECFYNKTCIKLFLENYDFDVVGLVRPLNDSALHIQPLRNENTRFYPTTTINEIFSQLFIEEWINSSNFTSYYTRCSPLRCIYTLRKRFDTAFMLTIMLGFYGGLSELLNIILPLIVKVILQRWLKRKKQEQIDNTEPTMHNPVSSSNEFCYCFRNLCKKLKALNLFESDPHTTEKLFGDEEMKATHIYVFLFVICIIGASVYSGPFSEETKSTTIKFPTIHDVNDLHQQNISSLSCPCSKAAVRYSDFLSIKPEYHSICSSEYISSSYILNIFQMNTSISLELSTHYRIISSLCHLSHRFIENAQNVFDAHDLITVDTLTHSSFNSQINALISTFITQTSANYRRTLSFIIRSFSANQLLHLFTTNWKVDFTDENENYIIKTSPHRFSSSNCSCAISSNCSEKLTDDIFTGCFPYDGFRLSKFKNLSLEKLNDHLFVDIWINQSDYTNYFEVCQPFQCQYTSSDKNNPMVMFTTVVGLYGGLTYILHLIVGESLLAYQWWIKYRRQNQIETISTDSVFI